MDPHASSPLEMSFDPFLLHRLWPGLERAKHRPEPYQDAGARTVFCSETLSHSLPILGMPAQERHMDCTPFSNVKRDVRDVREMREMREMRGAIGMREVREVRRIAMA